MTERRHPAGRSAGFQPACAWCRQDAGGPAGWKPALPAAVDADMFRAANPEMVGTLCKVYPFLEQLRQVSGIPEFLRHVEAVVTGAGGGVERMEMLRGQFLAARAAKEV